MIIYASSPMDTGVGSYLFDSAWLVEVGIILSSGAGSRPAATHFAFASPKESKQRKGDPQSGSLRFASGNL
jgi:hypothetical protein